MSKFTISKSHDFIVYRVDGVVTCIRCAISGKFVSKVNYLKSLNCKKIELFHLTRLNKELIANKKALKTYVNNEVVYNGLLDDIELINGVMLIKNDNFSVYHPEGGDSFRIIDKATLKPILWIEL